MIEFGFGEHTQRPSVPPALLKEGGERELQHAKSITTSMRIMHIFSVIAKVEISNKNMLTGQCSPVLTLVPI